MGGKNIISLSVKIDMKKYINKQMNSIQKPESATYVKRGKWRGSNQQYL